MRRSHAATAIASLTSERDWQRQVTEAAELFGWSWVVFRPARTERGWRTPVSGPLGKGWPDLTLVRGNRIIMAELKVELAQLSPSQRAVHDLLRGAVELHVWRPSDLAQVLDTLR